MKVVFKRCAGLDVHNETVVACARKMHGGRVEHVVEQFGTTTSELLRLLEWLQARPGTVPCISLRTASPARRGGASEAFDAVIFSAASAARSAPAVLMAV